MKNDENISLPAMWPALVLMFLGGGFSGITLMLIVLGAGRGL